LKHLEHLKSKIQQRKFQQTVQNSTKHDSASKSLNFSSTQYETDGGDLNHISQQYNKPQNSSAELIFADFVQKADPVSEKHVSNITSAGLRRLCNRYYAL